MSRIRPQVELFEKNKPRQARAKRTYDNILLAAAELLVEVGVERISTNLIAEHAGITVPALYRYFPNKYAVLYALGAALMDLQNQIFENWQERHFSEGGATALMANVEELLLETHRTTRNQVGGHEITQSLRAVQPLQELRQQSHALIAERFCEVAAHALGREPDEEMTIHATITVDAFYSLVELALNDGPIPAEGLLRHGGRMIQLYWQDVIAQADSTV